MVTANDKLRGVNLGGWLVLERWMTPSVFSRRKAEDEYSLCLKLGEQKKQILKHHRDSFITREDFKWIAVSGLNAVRIPVGYWIFGSSEPYVAAAGYMDKAMEWAKDNNLQVIIDLHAALGSQNGWGHSGKSGDIGWHVDLSNIEQTVDIIGKIAEKYGSHTNLWGIELVNEPHPDVPLCLLQDYYRQAYYRAREHCNKDVRIIISDAYRPIAEWEDFVNSSEFKNLLLDLHLYQAFSGADKKLDLKGHIDKIFRWRRMIELFGPEKILIGEWSAEILGIYDAINPESARLARKLYMDAQEYAFADCAGWMYWSYKTENHDNWNYRYIKTNL